MADKKEDKKPKVKQYIVIAAFGNHVKGDILPESREVRRKLDEGGTVTELTDELLKEKKAEKIKKKEDLIKKDAELKKNRKELANKKMQKPVENKMEFDDSKNKGGK